MPFDNQKSRTVESETIERLEYAERLLFQCKLDEALEIINSTERNIELDPKNSIKFLQLKSRVMNKRGYYKQGLEAARKSIEKSKALNYPLLEVDGLIRLAEALFNLGELDKIPEVTRKCHSLINKHSAEHGRSLERREADVYRLEGRFYFAKGEFDLSLDNFQKSLTLYENNGDFEDVIISLNFIGATYRQKGDFNKCLEYLTTILDMIKESENIEIVAFTYNNLGLSHWQKGDFNKSLDYFQQSLKLKKEIGNEHEIARALHNIGIISVKKGDFMTALDYYKQGLALFEQLGNQNDIALSAMNIGNLYRQTGELDKALEYSERSLSIFKKIGNRQYQAYTINNIGDTCMQKGDLNKALEYSLESLDILKEIGNKQDIAIALDTVAQCYKRKGELTRSLTYLDESLALKRNIGNKQDIAYALGSMGNIYKQLGEMDKAMELYQESLEIFKEKGHQLNVATTLLSIGDVYRQKGSLEEALERFERSLALAEKTNHAIEISGILYSLVLLLIDMKFKEKAEMYLDRLESISQKEDIKIIAHYYKIAAAVVLKSSNRTRDRAKAEELLDQVIKEDVVDFELTVTAMLSSCDLLLYELKTVRNKEVLEEITLLFDKLISIATAQHSYSLLSQVYLLQSKLALLQLDIEQSKKLLSKARKISAEKGLNRLLEGVEMIKRKVDELSELSPDDLEYLAGIWEKMEQDTPDNYLLPVMKVVQDYLTKLIKQRSGLEYFEKLVDEFSNP
ncbi:MAG: tetratricopeptide repeat protein [Candidatus Odinarchaeota archaeon]